MTTESDDVPTPWPVVELREFPGVEYAAYGIARQQKASGGIPMIRATEIVEGGVYVQEFTFVPPDVARRHPRSTLRSGDLLVVLVGRVGEAAVAGEEHAGWNVGRSLAVVRWTPEGRAQQWDLWLRWWLKTSQSQSYLTLSSSNAEHMTLPLQALNRLPVPVPPAPVRERLFSLISLAERKNALNTRIVSCATELADAHFMEALQTCGQGPATERAVGEVCQVTAGAAQSLPDSEQSGMPWVSPREVLNCKTVHLGAVTSCTVAQAEVVCPSGSLLIAPRPGEVRTVLTTTPVVPGRRTLAIYTESEVDRMWLLHSLRYRRRELTVVTQGEQARAMRRKDFSRYKIPWPTDAVRRDFARRAAALHDLAYASARERHVMEELVVHELEKGGLARPTSAS
ncbi:hypothetical protein OHS17_21915 [Streptomyces sp. NBC_00523]|uniref:hypothetical protein n=1 Tax=Streptomyces sp. NBC_00523 TaxID=2975765 RepID=UPI002E807A0A|nr:hypothetical protein [Streptomyces sp. NBC_00523]WUD02135.1 hypothetical protein OHS17_21915 [Streptomyces sp. NBC_00523]